jgi:hypothetical protein
VNTIAPMNCFPTTRVAFWFWGMLWSPSAFGWGTFWSPPAWGSGSACTKWDSRQILMTDFWSLSNRGTMTTAGCRRFGSGPWAMTVFARHRFFGSWTHVVHIVYHYAPDQDVGTLAGWANCLLRYQMKI